MSLKPDEMGIDGQLQNFWGPLFPAGTVSGRDQISQSHVFGFDPTGGVVCSVLSFHDACESEPCSISVFDQPSLAILTATNKMLAMSSRGICAGSA
jgi:hypothetical protein